MAHFHPGTSPLARVWVLLEHHRPQQAAQLARQCLADDPTHAPTHVALAEALRQLDRLDEAREIAQTAIGLAPEAARGHHLLALILGQQGHLRKATAAIDQALQLDPTRGEFFGLRAQLCYVQGQYHAAIQCAGHGLQADARQADCLLWRALAQEKLARTTASDATFDQALRLAPNSALVHQWRGKLLLQRYEPQQAALHLTEALRLTPTKRALLPLLQQARRQQLWPAWLTQLHQKRQRDWSTDLPVSWTGPVIGILMPFFELRSWWQTRTDPLFQENIPGQRRVLAKRWGTTGAVVASIGIMGFACLSAGMPFSVMLLGLVMPLLMLAVGAMIRSKSD
ncbi:tetratricopeptide repeat protein [Hymenobacter segetis]|uniref:Tetratricopeptide repeat protein n=1 Tax=Hymenobacter segetis TaxID=2025509 RepID=A0ABU9M3E2_9BACT